MIYLKLYQGCIFGIIILAISCAVHSRNETSVNWTIHGSVHFGNTTILNCKIDRKFNVCEDDLHIRRWTKYPNQTILTFEENSSNETKYKGNVNKHCTSSSLHIYNFGPNDFGVYTCSFGLHSKEFRLERSSYQSFLIKKMKKNINVNMLCSNNHLDLDIEIQETFPTPMCYSNIKDNSKRKNRKVHTHITGVQNATKDKIKYKVKDHSCSGVIHTFCLIDKTKVKVFNRIYDCCKDTHVSLLLIVPIGCAITISAVIVCIVYWFKKKKIGFCRTNVSSCEESVHPFCGAQKEEKHTIDIVTSDTANLVNEISRR